MTRGQRKLEPRRKTQKLHNQPRDTDNMNQKPLRYQIDNWSEVVHCKSNMSRKLHLTYNFVMDDTLQGEIIRVEHERFGCLFSYLVSGSGSILQEQKDGLYFELPPNQILKELYKYGFDIRFRRKDNLSGEQLSFLVDLQKLGMDKIRFLYVEPDPEDEKTGERYRGLLVAFNIADNPRWLFSSYICSFKEFNKELMNGSVINISAMEKSKKFDWSFLKGKVLSIPDILASEG